MSELITKHFLIQGRVQGVGFRRFVEREALTLGVSGWVRNREDGRVEALACCSPTAMDQFIAKLHEGPVHSNVETVEVRESHEKIDHTQHRFIIRESASGG